MVKILSNFENFRSWNNGNLKKGRFLQKLKGWPITCYTDRPLANQIAGKPVRISWPYNNVYYYPFAKFHCSRFANNRINKRDEGMAS